MSQQLNKWQAVYLGALRSGSTHEQAEALSGASGEMVLTARKDNPAFGNAYTLTMAGVMAVVVSPQELMRVMEAQTPDDMVAAYFGMGHTEFLDYVNRDDELKRVYETARKRGLAKLQGAVYDTALAGDPGVQKFLAAHLLGMNDTQKVEITHKREIDDQEAYRQLQSMIHEAKLKGAVDTHIEADYVEVVNQQLGSDYDA